MHPNTILDVTAIVATFIDAVRSVTDLADVAGYDRVCLTREAAVAALLACPQPIALTPERGYTLSDATTVIRAAADFREAEAAWNALRSTTGATARRRYDGWLAYCRDSGTLRREARILEGAHENGVYSTLFVSHADCAVCAEHRAQRGGVAG